MTPGAEEKTRVGSREDPSTLFIRNLPRETTTSPFEAHVSALVGPVRRCVIVTDSEGKCRGYGFVQFALRGDAERGLDLLDGGIYKGRKLKVETARMRVRKGGRGNAENKAVDVNDDKTNAPPGKSGKKKYANESEKERRKKKRVVGSVGMRTVVVRWRERGKSLSIDEVRERLKGDGGKELKGIEAIAGSADGCEVRCIFDSWVRAGKGAAHLHCADDNGPEAYVEALYGGKKCRLIVRNLPYEVDPVSIRRHFEKIATVRDVNIPLSKKFQNNERKSTGKKAKKVFCDGFAFIEYFLAADASKAITTLNGSKIEGRVCSVDLALSKSAYEAKAIKDAKANGETASLRKKRSHDEAVDDISGVELDEEDCARHTPKKQKKEAKSSPEELERTVFVRNLSYETSAEELRRVFLETFGKVEQCVLVMDRITGRPRGTAFVRFAEIDAAQAAVASSTGERIGLAAKFPNLAEPPEPVVVAGRKLLVCFAVNRETAATLKSSLAERDTRSGGESRNIHLAPIGHIVAGTTEAKGLSASDLAKRAASDKAKRNKLAHDPHSFVSPTRLSIRNLPRSVMEADLKILFGFAATYERWKTAKKCEDRAKWRSAKVDHAKIVHGEIRKNRSKGFGFVSFVEHEDAMAALKMTNNNPNLEKMLGEQAKLSEMRKIGIDCESDLKEKKELRQVRKAEMRLQELQERLRKLWNGRRLVVEFAVEDRRIVNMIANAKTKGKEMKALRRKEQSKGRDEGEKDEKDEQLSKETSKNFDATAAARGNVKNRRGRSGGEGAVKKQRRGKIKGRT